MLMISTRNLAKGAITSGLAALAMFANMQCARFTLIKKPTCSIEITSPSNAVLNVESYHSIFSSRYIPKIDVHILHDNHFASQEGYNGTMSGRYLGKLNIDIGREPCLSHKERRLDVILSDGYTGKIKRREKIKIPSETDMLYKAFENHLDDLKKESREDPQKALVLETPDNGYAVVLHGAGEDNSVKYYGIRIPNLLSLTDGDTNKLQKAWQNFLKTR